MAKLIELEQVKKRLRNGYERVPYAKQNRRLRKLSLKKKKMSELELNMISHEQAGG